MLYRTTLPPEPASVPVARHWAADLARTHGLGHDSLTTLGLVVTELTSNAVKHAASEFTVELDVTVPITEETEPLALRIAVTDADSRLPRTEPIDDGALGGRGLWLVTSLTKAFGVDSTAEGKTVWALLLDDADTHPHPAEPYPTGATTAMPGPGHHGEAAEAKQVVPAQSARN